MYDMVQWYGYFSSMMALSGSQASILKSPNMISTLKCYIIWDSSFRKVAGNAIVILFSLNVPFLIVNIEIPYMLMEFKISRLSIAEARLLNFLSLE